MIRPKFSETNIYTVAFYNLENLFDTIDDSKTFDDDFTPRGKKRWTKERYKKKIRKLGKAISYVGYDKSLQTPALIGVAEVENQKVLRDLTKSKHLRAHDYSIVHFDSFDERGIDVGFLYKADIFEVIKTETLELKLYKEHGVRDYSRDILYIHGKFLGEETHLFINHWPSRRSGVDESEDKRLVASETLANKVNSVLLENQDPNIIIMGDFNDDPQCKSIQNLLKIDALYNPMDKLFSTERGSLNYDYNWNLFDQIIFSHNYFNYEKGTVSFLNADIFDETFLREWKGKNKGNPFRSYRGRRFLGGYSDHFPVYIHLKHHSNT